MPLCNHCIIDDWAGTHVAIDSETISRVFIFVSNTMTGPTFVFRDAVFHNAELMANIFGLLAVDYSMKAEERRRTRKSLLTTALASKVFKECAMNLLWSIIPSLVPLLCLIPSFINLDGVYVRNQYIKLVPFAG